MIKIRNSVNALLPHVGAVLFFFVLVLLYFYPEIQGKVLQQGDINKYEGMVQEVQKYQEQTGIKSAWTGSMFSGMPTYHISYGTGNNYVNIIFHVLFGLIRGSAGIIFAFLVTSYILFLVIGSSKLVAVFGAIATAFSSYNIIILVAGHITKAWALAYAPLVIAGLVAVFKKRYLFGGMLFAIGLTMHIFSNHLQITYYTGLLCVFMFIGLAVYCIREREYKNLLVSGLIIFAGLALAIGTNISNLYMNYELGKVSTRGPSELTPAGKDKPAKASSGLDKDYAFQWSYGKAETFSLLIPNVMGGESGGKLGRTSNVYKAAQAQGAQLGDSIQFYTYWGEKPFTSGPVYFGAVICFLFVFAFFIVKNPYKWWLLFASVFFVLLAWGKNLAWFNDFMFYHFPYYSKFRTVEMALVMPSILFPILAGMALNELDFADPDKKRILHALKYSTITVGGICLILWIVPNAFFNFQSSFDSQYNLPDSIYTALLQDRKGLLQSDAFRSLVFVLLTAGCIYLYQKSKDKKKNFVYLISSLIVLVLVDLWSVDKRYLNAGNYVDKMQNREQNFKESVADASILKDKSLSYRVLNLNDPFQETNTSYYHKSIGGYHAAKLRRYQDLIDRRLTPELNAIITVLTKQPTVENLMNTLKNCSSLNMLNTKYIIINPANDPVENPYRYGNAWFVRSYKLVDTPDEEISALDRIDPRTEAVIDKKFADNLKGLEVSKTDTASDKIDLSYYAPDRLKYRSHAKNKGLAVLSEIYYPYGWKATIDGRPTPISRVDWTLRAIVVPAGEHTIELQFRPDRMITLGNISTALSALLVILLILSIIFALYKKSKEKEA